MRRSSKIQTSKNVDVIFAKLPNFGALGNVKVFHHEIPRAIQKLLELSFVWDSFQEGCIGPAIIIN